MRRRRGSLSHTHGIAPLPESSRAESRSKDTGRMAVRRRFGSTPDSETYAGFDPEEDDDEVEEVRMFMF